MAKFVPKHHYQYGFSSKEISVFKIQPGLDQTVIRQISAAKHETQKMLNFRLRSYQQFLAQPLPSWGPDLSDINFDSIRYYLKPADKEVKNWDNLPPDIKTTYAKLGIPQAEKEYLGGVKAQYESEVVYGSLMSQLAQQGVIFCSMDEAVAKYPDLVWSHFAKIVPASDNKFAALNSAVWSGGSFIYIPKGLKVDLPLQAYFRINSQNMGQFERTLIIIDEGAFVHYVEGCTAPTYSTDSLHAAVVEIYLAANARCRYTTIQNWSTNVYNLVIKRAYVEADGVMEWVDGNLGSKTTLKYPSTILAGPKAHGEILSIAVAGRGQILDAGGKAVHLAPDTTSQIISKSISFNGGQSSYQGTAISLQKPPIRPKLSVMP